MNKFSISLIFVMFSALSSALIAQGDDKVDVFSSVTRNSELGVCEKFELGSLNTSVTPEYPPDARTKRLGGAVRLEVTVNQSGIVSEIIHAEGEEILVPAATEAARKTRFTVSRCNGSAVAVKGVLIFNFIPLLLTDVFTTPSKASEFSDVTASSPFYESVLALTDNYKIAFGYADGKFHPDAPLTKGDFAHFLRITLDLLQQRAEVSKKIPLEIDLYFPMNPLHIKSANSIIDLDSRKPYADSVKILVSKYDVALTNDRFEFQGKLPMTYNEVIGYWTKIFGEDTVPVNFTPIEHSDRIMNRGEFALFLHESLFVLTYKVLP